MKTGIRQQGFAYVAAVVLLVVLAALATAAIRLSTTQQVTSTQDIQGMRANQAARAGIEWGLHRLRNGQCASSTNLNDFENDTGFKVTVTCSVPATPFREGESATGAPIEKNLYRLEATACNGGLASCPDAARVPTAEYVERKRVATVCLTTPGNGDCY